MMMIKQKKLSQPQLLKSMRSDKARVAEEQLVKRESSTIMAL
jgi:hypothetical protein